MAPEAPTLDDAGSGALARCVGDVERFRSAHWGRHPLLRRNPGGTSFDDLLSLDAVDHLVAATSIRQPAFRLVRDGKPLPPAAYTRRVRIGGRELDDVADVAQVHRHFAEGATIVLQGLQRYWPPLTRFCRELQEAIDHPVQANAYVTPARAQGLGRHADAHDVFLLQVLGSKHWRVHEPGDPAEAEAVLDTELAPGDVLYLPTGAHHSARTMASASVHVTVGVLNVTWARVLADLVARAHEELGAAETLPLGFGRDPGFPAAVAARLAELAAWVGRVDADEAAEAARQRFRPKAEPVRTGQLRQLVGLDALSDATVLRRREGAACTVVALDGALSVQLADRTLTMPTALEPAVREIAGRTELRGEDLADHLDPESRLVLLRRLVREGLLEAADR